jgi:hypothetical protein
LDRVDHCRGLAEIRHRLVVQVHELLAVRVLVAILREHEGVAVRVGQRRFARHRVGPGRAGLPAEQALREEAQELVLPVHQVGLVVVEHGVRRLVHQGGNVQHLVEGRGLDEHLVEVGGVGSGRGPARVHHHLQAPVTHRAVHLGPAGGRPGTCPAPRRSRIPRAAGRCRASNPVAGYHACRARPRRSRNSCCPWISSTPGRGACISSPHAGSGRGNCSRSGPTGR